MYWLVFQQPQYIEEKELERLKELIDSRPVRPTKEIGPNWMIVVGMSFNKLVSPLLLLLSILI